MIKNISKSTVTLEWMGRRKEIPSGWSTNLDPESESYLLIKYPDVLKGDIKENLIEKLLDRKIEKESLKKIKKVVKSKKRRIKSK